MLQTSHSPNVDILYSEYNCLDEVIIMIIISRRGDSNVHHSKCFMDTLSMERQILVNNQVICTYYGYAL